MSERNDEFRRQLGTLWRIAQEGMSTVRDVAMWSSHAGRLRVDLALMQRERDDLYRELGQQLTLLVSDGRLTVPPPLRETYGRLRTVLAHMRQNEVRLHDNAFGAPRGFEPEAAEDYDYGAIETVDAPEEKVVDEGSTPRASKAKATKRPTRKQKK